MISSEDRGDSRCGLDYISFTNFLGEINEAYYDFHLNSVCNLNKNIIENGKKLITTFLQNKNKCDKIYSKHKHKNVEIENEYYCECIELYNKYIDNLNKWSQMGKKYDNNNENTIEQLRLKQETIHKNIVEIEKKIVDYLSKQSQESQSESGDKINVNVNNNRLFQLSCEELTTEISLLMNNVKNLLLFHNSQKIEQIDKLKNIFNKTHENNKKNKSKKSHSQQQQQHQR